MILHRRVPHGKTRFIAPEGLEDSAQGFNPGNRERDGSSPRMGLQDLAQGFNPGLYTQIGETADICKASLMVRIDTGWKPILLYAVARRDGSAEMIPA
jgi:hypothetical protein